MTDHAVAIIGAGLGGIGAALGLKRDGIASFVVFEKANGIGGTWRDNRYPGCCCDAPAVLYWYSPDHVPLAEQPRWSNVYPRQDEILTNLVDLARRRGVLEHCMFDTEVTAATWTGSLWRLETSAGEHTARFLVCATGQLSRPVIPEVPGRADFGGAQFHSARWDHSAAYAGKRVAVIGNGASGVQIAPAIAPEVARLEVFQRTPSHILPRMDRPYSDEERALLSQPSIRAQARRTGHEFMESTFRAWLSSGPRTATTTMLDSARQHLEAQVADPVLRSKLWPTYGFGCKRPLLSDDFYPIFERDHVFLISDRITHIDHGGIWTADGVHHPVDVIVYATGFETQSIIGPIQIRGPERDLASTWSHSPISYLGVMVAGYPNFFMLYGPNTNLGHNSVLSMHEAQIAFFLRCVRAVAEQSATSIDVTEAAMAQSHDETRGAMRELVWATDCTSWYKNEAGDVVTQWTKTAEEYARQLTFRPEHVVIR